MPAKAKKATPRKTASSAASRRVAARSVRAARPARPIAKIPRPHREESIWTKQYFLEPQIEFFRRHTNAQVLLALFIGAALFYFFIVWSNRVEIFPELFSW